MLTPAASTRMQAWPKYLQRTPGRIFEPIDRESPRTEHPGQVQPIPGTDPVDLEAVARLQADRRGLGSVRMFSAHR